MPDEYGITESRANVVSVSSTNASQLNAAIAPQEPSEQQAGDAVVQYQEPCTLRGLAAGLGGGSLGALFGFLPAVVKNKGRNWSLITSETTKSAYNFGLMGGVYTAVLCLCQRVRQVEDTWNHAAAGCASGVAISWQNGPLAAAQSCAFIAAFSCLLGGGTPAAEAATVGREGSSTDRIGSSMRSSIASSGTDAAPRSAASHAPQSTLQPWEPAVKELQRHLHSLPRLAFLAPCCNVRDSGRVNGCSISIGNRR